MDKQPDWVPAMAALGGDKVLLGRLDGSLAVYAVSTGLPVAGPPAPAAPKPMAKAAPATKPELLRLEPRGVQSGTTTRVRASGKNLQGLKSVKLGLAGMKAIVVAVNQTGTVAELDVEAAATVPRTQVDISLVAPGGGDREAAPARRLSATDRGDTLIQGHLAAGPAGECLGHAPPDGSGGCLDLSGQKR